MDDRALEPSSPADRTAPVVGRALAESGGPGPAGKKVSRIPPDLREAVLMSMKDTELCDDFECVVPNKVKTGCLNL
eukprot:1626021-Heterocapsa_arctica.AAC.1